VAPALISSATVAMDDAVDATTSCVVVKREERMARKADEVNRRVNSDFVDCARLAMSEDSSEADGGSTSTEFIN